MARYSRVALCCTVLLAVALSGSAPSTQPLLSIDGYVKISEVRVTRTVSDFVYKATLTNAGPPLAGATAQASSTSPATTIVDGALTFGPVGNGGSVQSTDTFTFRVDRTVAFDFSSIQWSITPVAGNRAPVADAGPDQPIAGIGTLVSLNGTASSDPDGDALSYAWTLIQRPGGSASTLAAVTTATPTSVADKKGTYVAQLIVNDGTLASAPDTVTITVGNTAPVANAGPDQTAAVGTLVSLSGVGSTDADGDPLTYSWLIQSRPAGSAAVLSSTTTVNPTFTVDVTGAYTVQLIVNDGIVNSVADTVVIDTRNTAPIANAGPDQTKSIGQTVNLTGAASSDADGNPLTYAWALTVRPAGSTAVLSSLTAVNPTFVVDRPGTYRAQLIVNDGIANSAADTVDITTQNSIPIAEAGPNQSVTVGTTVTLNGSGSTDVDGDPLTYFWSFTSKPAGSGATLSNVTSVMPTFVVDVPGNYVAQLIVNDGIGPSAPDTVTISTQNSGPIANAGPDQSLVAGQIVSLTGAGSSDADNNPLTYAWSFTMRPAGSTAALSSTTAVNPTFTADRPGTFIVQLIVNDGVVNSAPDSVTISSTNATPVANAGPDQLDVPISSTVTLDGSASSDANSQPLTYLWALLSKPAGSIAQLSNTTVVSPTFSADFAGDYVAQLIVNDGFASSAPDTVTVRVVLAALPVVSIVATDGTASEAGGDTGTFTVSRTGSTANPLTVLYSVGGTATNGTDYQLIATSVVIPAGFGSAPITITPQSDGAVEVTEDVVLTISANPNYQIAAANSGTVTIADAPQVPVVTVVANDASASELGADTGVFRFSRTGSVASALTVQYSVGGTATNGTDYTTINGSVTILATQTFADVTITPVNDGTPEPAETVIVTVTDAAAYDPGTPVNATVTIADGSPVVTVSATDSGASEIYPDTGTFTVTRTGSTAASLTVNFTVTGTATAGADYPSLGSSVTIPIGDLSATAVVAPVQDGFAEPDESVILTLAAGSYNIGAQSAATVTIGDCASTGGALINGAMHCGNISTAGEVDTWTFSATAGERIALSVGEVVDNNDLRPWLRLISPNGTELVNTAGVAAAVADGILAPLTGNYVVQIASFDSGFDGTGSYRITLAKSPGPITVSPNDQGGPLTNGGTHTGEIVLGDIDVWTFSAVAGERIALSVGDIIDNNDFRPWLRVYAPNGAVVTNTSGVAVAVLDGAVAPVTGTYLVLISSFDSLYNGTGTYRLTLAKTPAPIVVSPGDQGGPLTNGGTHTGEIVRGDLDVWTFTATAGDRIAINVADLVDNDDFRPWLRVYAPNGAVVENTSGVAVAVLDGAVAPVDGTYLVLVSSFDSFYDGTGTYRLTLAKTPPPTIVSPGDEGGPLTNGATHTGEIVRGDIDVWTFTANVGDRIAINVGDIVDNDDFRPWLRVYAPNGAVVENTSGVAVAVLDGAVAPVTGTYLVLISSFDSSYDGTGTYRLTLVKTPPPTIVSPGDEGGPLDNGATHTGEIVRGDIDVWTFTATAGDRIAINVGDIVDNDDFRPWLRVYAPNGAVVTNTSGVAVAVLDGAVAPVTGTYLVLISSFDSFYDGTGTYRLTLVKTPPPTIVSPGDEGGPLDNGATHTGEIVRGDIDVWTFTANVGDRISINVGDIVDNDDFRPWLRVYAPNGAVVTNTSGVAVAALDGAVAPVTGTYLVLISSFDSSYDGTGTYRLTLAKTGAAVTVSAGDQGGALTNFIGSSGEIVRGDLDVWTFSATAGQRISAQVTQTSETGDFRPWMRIYAPNGSVVANTAGLDVATVSNAVAPVSGTYLVIVGSFDSFYDGAGTYTVSTSVVSPP